MKSKSKLRPNYLVIYFLLFIFVSAIFTIVINCVGSEWHELLKEF